MVVKGWTIYAGKPDWFLQFVTKMVWRYMKRRGWTYITIYMLGEEKPHFISARAKKGTQVVSDQHRFIGGTKDGN